MAHITTRFMIGRTLKKLRALIPTINIFYTYFETINMNHMAPIFSSILVNFCFSTSPFPPPPLQCAVLFSMLLTDSWDQELRRHGGDALTLYHSVFGFTWRRAEGWHHLKIYLSVTCLAVDSVGCLGPQLGLLTSVGVAFICVWLSHYMIVSYEKIDFSYDSRGEWPSYRQTLCHLSNLS